jgi:ribose transport system substrate-binding protein
MENAVRRLAVACLIAVAVLALAACGSSSSNSSSTGSTSTAGGESGSANANLKELETEVANAAESTYTDPPATSPKPEPGKRITALVYGLEAPSGATFAKAVEKAGTAIGWNVDVVDGQFSTNKYLEAVRKAIAEKVDGIIVYVIDCPSFQAAAEEAKKAEIPIVYVEGYDCSDLKSGAPETGYSIGEYNLLAKTERGSLKHYETAAGELQAAAAAVANEGNMKSIVLNETDANVTLDLTRGFLNVSEACGTCQVEKEIDFVGGDLGPKLTEKVEQALLSAPEANTIFGNYDDPVISGAAPAVRASGRSGSVYVTGAAGYEPMMELIRNGEADMTVAISVDWYGFSALDRLNRLFHGETKAPDTGIGLELVDQEDNLPPKGQAWSPSIDFESLYEKAWGVG